MTTRTTFAATMLLTRQSWLVGRCSTMQQATKRFRPQPMTQLVLRACISTGQPLRSAAPKVAPKRCLRITGFNKRDGTYYRCNTLFHEDDNTEDSCKFHEIGLFDRVGPGNWWNCCKKSSPKERGCRLGYHSADVDDSELRGHTNDPKRPEDLIKTTPTYDQKVITGDRDS
eukprot:m.64485 g.64485  ORF g.64485 m.64485 type:complete len:171 (-) comp23436_c0_seq1:85-597(-)